MGIRILVPCHSDRGWGVHGILLESRGGSTSNEVGVMVGLVHPHAAVVSCLSSHNRLVVVLLGNVNLLLLAPKAREHMIFYHGYLNARLPLSFILVLF